MDKKIIWDDGEQALMKAGDVPAIFDDLLEQYKEEYDEEEIKYFKECMIDVLGQVENLPKDKIILLVDEPMSGFYRLGSEDECNVVIAYKEASDTLTSIRSAAKELIEAYLLNQAEEFATWKKDMGASRILDYEDIIISVYEEFEDSYDFDQEKEKYEIEEDTIKRIIKEELRNFNSGDFENYPLKRILVFKN